MPLLKSLFFAAAAARFGPRKDEFPFVIVNESFCVRILKLGSYVPFSLLVAQGFFLLIFSLSRLLLFFSFSVH